MSNEFEDIEGVPEQEFSEVPGKTNELIASGNFGTEYDWKNAPDIAKAPPRINLNGETVTLNKADILLPPKDREWSKTRDSKIDVKYCTFVLHYDREGQQEFLSGVRVFNRDGSYSHPTITKDRKNQASKLMGVYADYKKKDLNEVNLREFLAFLNSKPKAVIEGQEFKNPKNEEMVTKNMIKKFV